MPLPPMDEEMPQDDGDAAMSQELERAQLEDLLEWARQGEHGQMRERLGKPSLDAEELPEELPPEEDADIPGVEASPEGEGGDMGGGPDMEKLKAALASMKMG